jgi:hypothetical protein
MIGGLVGAGLHEFFTGPAIVKEFVEVEKPIIVPDTKTVTVEVPGTETTPDACVQLARYALELGEAQGELSLLRGDNRQLLSDTAKNVYADDENRTVELKNESYRIEQAEAEAWDKSGTAAWHVEQLSEQCK